MKENMLSIKEKSMIQEKKEGDTLTTKKSKKTRSRSRFQPREKCDFQVLTFFFCKFPPRVLTVHSYCVDNDNKAWENFQWIEGKTQFYWNTLFNYNERLSSICLQPQTITAPQPCSQSDHDIIKEILVGAKCFREQQTAPNDLELEN